MPSIIPEYEYDIFISYRHNDNRSGWVTAFVNNLKVELAATIKEPVSVYFDSNPYDGLLETHNVDKSLESKLKSVIFIPILSQTYCDKSSFAWKQEFCVFNKLALGDKFRRDIKLNHGNVTSRILPVKIHDLDAEDKSTVETEIGGVLRAIEFIYKEPGVNRPLTSTDNKGDNQNKTDYRNQVNKLANAIKEILYSISKPTSFSGTESIVVPQSEAPDSRPSIAVLPFTNMSSNVDQEYFSDGITENIIIELAANKNLKIISRTSVMRYKKTTKSAPEIAEELDVSYILEGGVQVHGNKVRINVQLVDAVKDDLTWSKIFVESMDDIFEIQSNVAEVVAKELLASIGTDQNETPEEVPTKNLKAYDLFLKGRHAFNQWGVEGYKVASDYYKQAIELDPEFKQAYSALASAYSARMSWNGDLAPHEAQIQIQKYLAEAWRRGPSVNDYHTKAFVAFFIDKDFASAKILLIQAIAMAPNDASVMYTYSYLLNMMGRFEEAYQWVTKAKAIDPLTAAYFNFQTVSLYLLERYDEALNTIDEALQLYPAVLRFYDFRAKIYLTLEKWDDAENAVLRGFQMTRLRPPSMVAYLAIAYYELAKNDRGDKLLNELIERSESNEKGVTLYIVYILTARDNIDTALSWLKKAKQANDVDLIWLGVDPLLKKILHQIQQFSSPDFDAAEKHIVSMLEKEMPDLPYHNYEHIQDVLSASMVIAHQEKISDEEIKILRIAALLHDAGFIRSPKNHEANSAAIAQEILPDFGIGNDQINIIEKMILATRLPQSPVTLLEKILCDADLDYLGRDDFYTRGGTLLNELKDQGVVETEREWNLVQKTFLESHRYHTKYSKTNRESSKQERLQEIVAKLKTDRNRDTSLTGT